MPNDLSARSTGNDTPRHIRTPDDDTTSNDDTVSECINGKIANCGPASAFHVRYPPQSPSPPQVQEYALSYPQRPQMHSRTPIDATREVTRATTVNKRSIAIKCSSNVKNQTLTPGTTPQSPPSKLQNDSNAVSLRSAATPRTSQPFMILKRQPLSRTSANLSPSVKQADSAEISFKAKITPGLMHNTWHPCRAQVIRCMTVRHSKTTRNSCPLCSRPARVSSPFKCVSSMSEYERVCVGAATATRLALCLCQCPPDKSKYRNTTVA